MTPAALLGFVASVRGLAGDAKRKAIGAAVEQLQLHEVLAQPIGTLSKGFKRRVGLAQAILHDPEVLILDEPTDGLDPNQKHDVRELITRMAPGKASSSRRTFSKRSTPCARVPSSSRMAALSSTARQDAVRQIRAS